MINGKEPLIVKEKVGSGRSISLQSASNSVIYEKAISSKLIVNENNNLEYKIVNFVLEFNKQLGA